MTTNQDVPVTAVPTEAPVVYVQVAKKGNGFGVAALVLGIVALAFAFIPLFGAFIAIPTGAIGLILGVVGFLLKGRPKAIAITGASLSAVSLLLTILMMAAVYNM